MRLLAAALVLFALPRFALAERRVVMSFQVDAGGAHEVVPVISPDFGPPQFTKSSGRFRLSLAVGTASTGWLDVAVEAGGEFGPFSRAPYAGVPGLRLSIGGDRLIGGSVRFGAAFGSVEPCHGEMGGCRDSVRYGQDGWTAGAGITVGRQIRGELRYDQERFYGEDVTTLHTITVGIRFTGPRSAIVSPP